MGSYPEFKTRAIAFTAKEKAEVIDDIPCPAVDDETVVIKSRISGLSRGTEMDMYTGNFHTPATQNWPVLTGYEPIGEVVFAGEKVNHVKEGDRVIGYNIMKGFPEPYTTAWGGGAEYVVFSRESSPGSAGRRVVKVPEKLDDEQSVFGCLPAVAWHGVTRVNPNPGSFVVIIGLGVIGNSAAQYYQRLGCRVVAFDLYENRCQIARDCGILHAVNATEHDISEIVASMGEAPNIIVECAGEVDNISLCFDLAGPYGHIHLQGAYLKPYQFIGQRTIFPKSLCVTSSCGARTEHVAEAYRWIADGRLNVKPMFTKFLPVEKAQEGYQMALHEPDKCLKLTFKW